MNTAAGYEIKGIPLISSVKGLRYKDMVKNIDAMTKYSIGYLASGVTSRGNDISLGKNSFVRSGTCDTETSSDECKGQPKYTYVRNIPTGTIPPFQVSFLNLTGCNLTGLTEGRGIVPGMIEDVYDINPNETMRALYGTGNLGSDTCKKMTLPVGSKIHDKKEERTYETKCTSGFHTMASTTDKKVNKEVALKNPHIPNARLPGPQQLREGFSGFSHKWNTNKQKYFAWFVVIIFCLVLAYFGMTLTCKTTKL